VEALWTQVAAQDSAIATLTTAVAFSWKSSPDILIYETTLSTVQVVSAVLRRRWSVTATSHRLGIELHNLPLDRAELDRFIDEIFDSPSRDGADPKVVLVDFLQLQESAAPARHAAAHPSSRRSPSPSKAEVIASGLAVLRLPSPAPAPALGAPTLGVPGLGDLSAKVQDMTWRIAQCKRLLWRMSTEMSLLAPDLAPELAAVPEPAGVPGAGGGGGGAVHA
jgi:hypothetical protein